MKTNFEHIPNKVFAVHSGLLTIGKFVRQDRWQIELRWTCPLLRALYFGFYTGAQRPSRNRIRLCGVIAPFPMIVHWLIVLPFFLTVWAAGSLFAIAILCLGWFFTGLGERLIKIGRL